MLRWSVTATAVACALGLSSCTAPGAGPEPSKAPAPPATISLAVYGSEPVLMTYSALVKSFEVQYPKVKVKLQTFADHATTVASVRDQAKAGTIPDLFMVTQADLAAMRSEGLSRPVDELLGARELDFGDGYERTALETYSADAHLQCMPTEVSPLVVYYNPALVKLRTLVPKGDTPPDASSGWSFQQFAKAARKASTPRSRGVEVPRDLNHFAPFILSSGGSLVDDPAKPTKLTLDTPQSLAGIRPLLRLLRDPDHVYTSGELAQRSAVQRFMDGRLGMLVGDRTLTPVIRTKPGFLFGTMPMPKLTRGATTATVKGFCLAKKSEHPDQAADLLAFLSSEDSAKALADTGYIVPTNIAAIRSSGFAQPGSNPRGSAAFTDQMKSVRPMPASPVWDQVVAATRLPLGQLLTKPLIAPLKPRMVEINTLAAKFFVTPTG